MDTVDTASIGGMTSAEAFQRAAALHDEGKLDVAESILRAALDADPRNGDLWNARGVMLAGMKRYTDAIWCYREALVHNPSGSGVWTNLGNALANIKHLQSAVDCHRRAINFADRPGPLLYHNLGLSYAEAGRHSEAILAFSRALDSQPDYHTARWDRARSYLYLGNYQAGWSDYEVRQITGQLPKRDLPGVKWDGSPYPGKRLVLVCEQGFGDTLWVARYLPMVKALGGELIVECQPDLIPLIAEMGVADRIIPRFEALPEAHFYCYLCSLPGLFTSDFSAIPRPPYLSPCNDRIAKFRPVFAAAGSKLKVGIVWSGSVTFGRNRERAQPLLRFLQSFLLPGVQLYSLQKGMPEKEYRSLPPGGPLVDLAPMLDDFADTAAAVSMLDLVIMTDSAVAHLAAAMGRPVWLLLGHVAHWLWLLDRTESPWYPSMRFFRPRAEGDWDYVFDAAEAELMALLRSR